MIRFSRIRAAAGWALFVTLLGGALAPHSHPLVADSDSDGEGLSRGRSERVITDDGSSKLRWHSVLRIESDDDCFACHGQRTSTLTRPAVLQFVSRPQTPFVSIPAAEAHSVVRSATAPRGPPVLI